MKTSAIADYTFCSELYTISAYGTFFLFQINIAVTLVMTLLYLTMAMICIELQRMEIPPILLIVHHAVITPSLVSSLLQSIPITCNVAVYLHFTFDLSIQNMPLTLSRL